MNKTQKKKRELENYLQREEIRYCNKLKEEIKIFQKVNQISNLTKKRERSNSKDTKDRQNINPKKEVIKPKINENININLDSTIDKIFEIAEKQKSFEKTIKLLNFIVLKLKNESENQKFQKLIYIFSRIIFSELKNNPTEILDKFLEIYNSSLSILTKKEEENDLFKILTQFQIIFENESKLYNDDSFVFNSTEKKINQIFISLPDITKEEDEQYSNFQSNISLKKEIVYSSLLETSIKRNFCLYLYFNMSKHCDLKMRVYIKQFYRNIMLNHALKLNQSMKAQLKEAISEVENSKKQKEQLINSIDEKIKSTPLDSYYTVNDAREEKYVIANMSKWESKQNGIESTKQYYG